MTHIGLNRINSYKWITVMLTMGMTAGVSIAAGGIPAPLRIDSDPQLFLDDYMVDRTEGLARKIHPPTRLDQPVLDNRQFGTNQPYVSVLYDKKTNRFRIWYNRAPGIWYAESKEGVHWSKPVEINVPCTFCCSVIDNQEFETNPAQRYKFAGYFCGNGRNPGVWVAFSPDGKKWTAPTGNPVLPAYTGDLKQRKPYEVSDIVDMFYDPIHRRYGVAVKLPAVADDHFTPGPRAGNDRRRLVGMSVSDDFLHWTRPWRIFVPDDKDEGLTEFYGMGGIHARGSLLIGFVRVLRDDLPCDQGGPTNGIGYSVLATSRDGVSWHRYREPFLDRNPKPGSWDHAMAWMSAAVPVGDQLYLYYGGYARGHKIEMGRERQIGLAKLRKDGYVSLSAGRRAGTLVTKPLIFAGRQLRLNLDATGGNARVEIQRPDGQSIPGYSLEQCPRISTNDTGYTVQWQDKSDVSSLIGKSVRLKFVLSGADLYAFQFLSP